MNTPKVQTDDSARSPFAGCVILIGALLMMVFLIGFSIVALFRQFNAISKFTAEKPASVEVTSIENQEAALNRLAERIEAFRQQLAGDQKTELALAPDEMNLAIAAYEPFRDLRGAFRISSVENDTLRIAICFPLNGKPRLARNGEAGWINSDPRFLNATLIARPALLKREVVLQLERIEVPESTVPREFIEQMSPYRITERYLTDAVLGPAMAKLTRVGIADGKLVFTRIPGDTPSDEIGKRQVDHASRRFFLILGIVACVFLVFAGIVVFFGLRAKARRW